MLWDPREALGIGSSKARKEAGEEKEGMGGDQEGSEGLEALATSETVLPGPVSDLGI